uniref:ATP synthase subunit 8 n=1 Tax=Phyllodiaptomus tunguidus TaxID=2690417 RepID=A0A8K1KVK8_9MAXI|nr:ATP synthase subunit 8 [Phyllodiaptomus tunguidus]UDF84372.1 ATP synthase subunit 8 [Phyllodiaptomus tunguidus]UDF84385.1 ATP synthase subunit 8 [Phyllodiaptomus tunguidus]UDF84398.1 ATP synthase subunit 8 [Phyllodiaptomus tunguidus]
MPQMSPMNWLGLMLYFYLVLLILFTKIHFFMKISKKVDFGKSGLKVGGFKLEV